MSRYVKQSWATGDIITKDKLDHIEDGIYQADVPLDDTLTQEGAAADAKATGDALATKLTAADIDATLSETGKAADAAATGAALETKAEVDGYYEGLTAGFAEQLVSSVTVEDKVPYNFRTSGGSADIGKRLTDKIVGGTVAWNQGVPITSTSKTKTENGVTITDNRDGSYTVSTDANGATANVYFSISGYTLTENHVYLWKGTPQGGSNSNYCSYITSTAFSSLNKDFGNGAMYKTTSAGVGSMVCAYVSNGANITSPITFKPQLFDITQMFGPAIADYIYGLESATAGAGVAWFKKLFPKPYYAYNAGQLMSVNVSAHNTVGFNAWDEDWELGTLDNDTGAKTDSANNIRSKNYIPVVAGATYYANSAGKYIVVCFYDASSGYIGRAGATADMTFNVPDNCYYILFRMEQGYGTTYKNDICINLSWDGERDGEYEAYNKHTYALDESLELRGIPKLDANSNLYYDGDVYESDRTVTRNYAILTNQTGAIGDTIELTGCEPDAADIVTSKGHLADVGTLSGTTLTLSVALSGSDIVYPLATPITETADPFTNPQIVDDFGTEEYVDYAEAAGDRDVAIPVGHDTFYQNNLRAKLEMSPNSPNGDGDYVLRQTNGENVYVPLIVPDELPAGPTIDGTYRLVCTVADGDATLSWEAIT